ncbi:class I SAM-dependent RNA methyltransferase [Candidatus Saccharibacteria bacterium]|nr:class I SAM-dependent RNA methyltransferase [Candidatus Saccharibacteria bacterium]
MSKLPITVTDQPVRIEKLVPGGQGIGAREDGKKGFFWNTLPGETVVKYKIIKQKSHYFEAIAEEVKNPSEHRIAPKDLCFLSTSPWQIMDYTYELKQKKLILEELFRQFNLKIDENLLPKSVQTDNHDFFYRNKMEYALYWNNETEKIDLAFHIRGTHHKMPISSSSIERPEIFEHATKIITDLNKNHAEARKYQSLLLRANQTGEISGGLYENNKPHPVFPNLTDKILGKEYSYSPNGFFQINLPVYEMALEKIKEHIKTENVLDLYAGVGTIGLSVAGDKNLTLVENSKAAFKELEKNTSSVSNATAILSNSEDVLSYIAPDQTVILDPPRAGCDQKLLEKLLETKPKNIIYLSCNPATQARDLEILTKIYHIKNITPYNFFPRTPHLENLVILSISPDE